MDTNVSNVTIKKSPLPEPIGIVVELVNKTTKDLYLAAAYQAEGCRFLNLDKSDRSRMVFEYAGGALADQVERQWNEATLVVSATVYAAAIRHCKSMIHS